MDDLSICKRIAEIEGNKVVFDEFNDKQVKILIQTWCDTDSCYFDDYSPYNPLTDDALCFQLMVKYDIDVLSPYRKNGETKWEAQIFSKDYADAFSIYDESPNKAICLAIIEAHKESNND